MKFKFKVLMGTHIQEGKAIKKGQTFEAEQDLCKKFPGKFEQIRVGNLLGIADDDDDEDEDATMVAGKPEGEKPPAGKSTPTGGKSNANKAPKPLKTKPGSAKPPVPVTDEDEEKE